MGVSRCVCKWILDRDPSLSEGPLPCIMHKFLLLEKVQIKLRFTWSMRITSCFSQTCGPAEYCATGTSADNTKRTGWYQKNNRDSHKMPSVDHYNSTSVKRCNCQPCKASEDIRQFFSLILPSLESCSPRRGQQNRLRINHCAKQRQRTKHIWHVFKSSGLMCWGKHKLHETSSSQFGVVIARLQSKRIIPTLCVQKGFLCTDHSFSWDPTPTGESGSHCQKVIGHKWNINSLSFTERMVCNLLKPRLPLLA